jgi:hypothetical protein
MSGARATASTALKANRPEEGLCILVRTVSGSFRVAIDPAGTSWKSVPDLKVRAVPARLLLAARALGQCVDKHSNNAGRLRLQDGIKAATGFDPRHQRLFKENGEEYDGEAAMGLM